MILDKKIANGTPLIDIFPDQKDIILDVDNKSINHRPDLWGHYGFARELSVLFNTDFKEFPLIEQQKFHSVAELKDPSNILFSDTPQKDKNPSIKISIECPELVPRFSMLEVENLKTAPSPAWIRFRLYRVGLRAINNLVDVTNYVMLDIGQPMHIFDRNYIQTKKMIVRKAKTKENLISLYEKNIELEKQDIIITDGEKPISIAGVVGGKNSGVQENTKNALLEAACWHSSTIRKTSARIKHRTDASQRFEKSLDPHRTSIAIARAVDLLKETCPKIQRCGGLLDLKNETKKPVIIDFNPKKCFSLLNLEIPEKKMEEVLEKLGFAIKKEKDLWKVKVPSWRATRDISLPEDLIEEIGRFIGYENIRSQAPVFPSIIKDENEKRLLERKIKNTLISRNYYEIYTYPISNEKLEKYWKISQNHSIELFNPSSEEDTKMRLSLLPSMMSAITKNIHTESHLLLFEIGRIYFWDEKKENPQEKNILFLANYSEKQDLSDIFHNTKTTINILLEKIFGANLEISNPQEFSYYEHPLASGDINILKQKIGRIFSLIPQVKNDFLNKGNIVFVELDFDAIFSLYQKKKKIKIFQPISKFPTAKFEISLVVPKNTYFDDLKKVIVKEKLVQDVRFQYDYPLPDDETKKSMTISMVFLSPNETIQAEDLTNIQDKIVASCEKNGYLLRR